jgi:hypothetical protein
MFEHAVDGVEELAHHGDIGLHLGLAASEELLIERSYVGLPLHCDECGHEEGPAQMRVARSADAGRKIGIISGISARSDKYRSVK